MDKRTETGAARVIAPARLHLGFLDLNGGLGRRYGSIGLALDQPSTELMVSRGSAFSVAGPESERAQRAVVRFADGLALGGTYRVEVKCAIPAHAGLGSGTQLALAVGAGLMCLEGRRTSSRDLGELIERGARSAIGIAAFECGGFIVDGGRGASDHAPPVLIRTNFPLDWRVLLVLDGAAQGVHGDQEATAFANLPPMPEHLVGHLCRLVLMRLVPGLMEHDIDTFGAALTEIQEIVGSHFAMAQGGSAWTSPAVGRLIKAMGRRGAVGLGQSSWGPTGFAFVSSEAAAQRLYQSFVEDARADGLEILIARGRNAGARVETVNPAGLEP